MLSNKTMSGDELHISFGLARALPRGATIAWGARAIQAPRRGAVPPSFSLLHDRQGWIGSTDDQQAFTPLLKAALPIARKHYQQLVEEHRIRPDEDEVYTLYQDSGMQIVASTNGSHGYVYLAAWRVPDATTTP